jgi:hypothetical protein
MSHDRVELMRRIRAYAIRVAMLSQPSASGHMCSECFVHLLPHFPHELNTALQVAAPQQERAKVPI